MTLGAVEVRIAGNEGLLFKGVGPFGFREGFRVGDVAMVTDTRIILKSGHNLEYGNMLRGGRRSFMERALCHLLQPAALLDGGEDP